jgi:hypothetical protein
MVVSRFWAKMAVLYPGNWSKHFKTEKQLALAMQEWGAELEKLTLEQIKTGLDRLKDKGGDFPPSLPEFVFLCKDTTKGLTHNTAAYKIREFKRLPNKGTPEKGREAFDRMKEMLNSK